MAQASHGFVGATRIDRFKQVKVDRVRVAEGWTVDETVALYSLDPDVAVAEPNYYRSAEAAPNDPRFNIQWSLHNMGQTGGTVDADLDGPEAWSQQTGNSSVVVAVLDTGMEMDHEDLAGNLWMNEGEDWTNGSPGHNGVDDDGNGKVDDYYGWDFVNNDNNPDDDSTGHGTHVAGIIAADGNNGIGVAGVSWSASIMPLKMLSGAEGGLVSDEIAAIDYAIQKGAQIINASYGGTSFSQLEYNAIKRAQDAGILFVAAAGNQGTNNDAHPVYPASHDLGNIISVAATDGNDNLLGTSNYGQNSVDVAAPGYLIYSTTINNSYQYRSGTSMAAAHVSGLASLVWSKDFDLTNSQARGRIVNGVDVKSSLNGFVSSDGRINAFSSFFAGSPALPPSNSGGGDAGGGGGCFIGTVACGKGALGWIWALGLGVVVSLSRIWLRHTMF
jgi:subtilisin family serine protease